MSFLSKLWSYYSSENKKRKNKTTSKLYRSLNYHGAAFQSAYLNKNNNNTDRIFHQNACNYNNETKG